MGSDEIMVKTAEKIDDKTVELTLSGNSSDIYTSSDIYIEFNSNLLVDEKDGVVPYGEKIQLDEDGVKRAMYISVSYTHLHMDAHLLMMLRF